MTCAHPPAGEGAWSHARRWRSQSPTASPAASREVGPRGRGRPADRAVGARRRRGGVATELSLPSVHRTSMHQGGGACGVGSLVAGGLSFVESRQKEGRPCFCQALNRRRCRGSAMGHGGVTMCGRRFGQRALCGLAVPPACGWGRPPARARLPQLAVGRRITGFGLAGGRLRGLRWPANASRRSTTTEHNHVTLDLRSR